MTTTTAEYASLKVLGITYLYSLMILYVTGISVTLKSGAVVKGKISPSPYGNVNEFLGIPFAKPPTGNLRFKPPQPHPEDWEDELDVTEYGPVCQQSSLFLGYVGLAGVDISEDCLFLNVRVPGDAIDPNAKKAVMVGIHGGRLVFGASNMYYTSFLAARGDVIVVTLNYRLNIYGFFTSGTETLPGNVAFMDQTLALRWVQKNIELFGGDKERVTIFGESAGGESVSIQVLSPQASGLFNRAISMSGLSSRDNFSYREDLQDWAKTVATNLSCPIANEDEMVNCLQSASAESLNAVAFDHQRNFSAIVDGKNGLLSDQPRKLFASSKYSQVDYIAGVVSEDGKVVIQNLADFTAAAVTGLTEQQVRDLIIALPSHQAYEEAGIPQKAMDLYCPNLKDRWSNLRGMLDYFTDSIFLGPTIRGLDVVSVVSPTYLYYFTQTEPNSISIPEVDFGPVHAEELPYLFGLMGDAGPGPREVSRCMIETFTSFAKNGSPTFLDASGQTVVWQRYNKSASMYLEFKANMTSDSFGERLHSAGVSFWNEIVPGLTDPDSCKDDNPSLISREDCETALFILIAVTIVLLLGITIVVFSRRPASPTQTSK